MDAVYRMFERIVKSLDNVTDSLRSIRLDIINVSNGASDINDDIEEIKEDIVSIKERLDILEDDDNGVEEPEIEQ